MEIIITKCYVEFESKKDLELEKKYDQHSINLIHHFIYFNQGKQGKAGEVLPGKRIALNH